MKNYPIDVYMSTIERVPAYRDFLKQHCGKIPDVKNIEDFTKLPYTDKAGYIKTYPLAQRCLDGTLLGKHVITHSSGTSGKYQYWPSIPEFEKNYYEAIYKELDENYDIGKKSTLVILGILMGGSISGALFAYALRAMAIETGRITLVTPGPDDEMCIENMVEFSSQFEQTILYSYPATAKNIIEKVTERKIPIKDFNLKLRLLGEGYSEVFRDHINELLGYPTGCLTSINSGYGSTDFRGAGKETLLCVAIKRLLYENSKVKEVLGLDDIPTICQYDPTSIYIEEYEGELVMTRNNAVPLVRYRSGDAGKIFSYDDMMNILGQYSLDPLKMLVERGCDPQKVSHRPFVLVSGRKNAVITFYGHKIYVSDIKAILEENSTLAKQLTGEFQVRKVEDDNLNPYMELLLVPRPGVAELNVEEITNTFTDALITRQGGIFSAVLAKNRRTVIPRIRFVKREDIMTSASFKIRYLA